MRARLFALCILPLAIAAASCSPVSKPTKEETTLRDKWAQLVPPKDRQKIFDEAERHTSWSEKRKIVFEVNRFKSIYDAEQLKQRKARAATRPSAAGAASRPATAPAVSPAEIKP